MIKFIILTSLCALALGRANPPPPPMGQLPHLDRVAREAPKISDMGPPMGSAMPQLGNLPPGPPDTIDPMGLIKKSQDIAKEVMTGKKRRDAADLGEMNHNAAPTISSSW